jgi:hypothetical protein
MSCLAETKSGHYAFTGADSSFRLDFALTQAGVLTITGPRRTQVAKDLRDARRAFEAALRRAGV